MVRNGDLLKLLKVYLLFCRGPKFRKAFDTIGGLRSLTRAPFMALTGSAPHNSIEYINKSLSLEHPQLVMCSLNRPNIYLSVGKKSAVAVRFYTA